MKIQLNKQKKGFTLIELMVVIAILASLAAVGYGPIMDHLQDGDRQQASSNLKQVGNLLSKFNTDHGSYPCDATADSLIESNDKYDFGALKGDKSNDYLRQLFYKGDTTEATFFAKHAGTKESDNKIANGQCLSRGENAFAYVLRKESTNPEEAPGKRTVTSSNAPLAFSCVPSVKTPYSGEKLTFSSVFRGHAFMLLADQSVTDLEEHLEEDETDDTKLSFKDGFTPFPETKRGRDTSADYVVVSPDL